MLKLNYQLTAFAEGKNMSESKTIAFKMRIKDGVEDEYKKRHDEIWPELLVLLKDAGIAEYRIFLDSDTRTLFAVMQCPTNFDQKKLAEHEVMMRWWDYMADIMEVHESNEPVSYPLTSMFYFP